MLSQSLLGIGVGAFFDLVTSIVQKADSWLAVDRRTDQIFDLDDATKDPGRSLATDRVDSCLYEHALELLEPLA